MPLQRFSELLIQEFQQAGRGWPNPRIDANPSIAIARITKNTSLAGWLSVQIISIIPLLAKLIHVKYKFLLQNRSIWDLQVKHRLSSPGRTNNLIMSF
ncbi:MAG: hypothetical protein U7126_26105 [Microcoleus sp.]